MKNNLKSNQNFHVTVRKRIHELNEMLCLEETTTFSRIAHIQASIPIRGHHNNKFFHLSSYYFCFNAFIAAFLSNQFVTFCLIFLRKVVVVV